MIGAGQLAVAGRVQDSLGEAEREVCDLGELVVRLTAYSSDVA